MLKYFYFFDIVRYILQNQKRKLYFVDWIRYFIIYILKLSKCYYDCMECVVYLKGKNFLFFVQYVIMYLIWVKVGCYIVFEKKIYSILKDLFRFFILNI